MLKHGHNYPLYTSVHSGILLGAKKAETTQTSINWEMDKPAYGAAIKGNNAQTHVTARMNLDSIVHSERNPTRSTYSGSGQKRSIYRNRERDRSVLVQAGTDTGIDY